MRIRSTKPEFWRSERIASVSWDARLVLKGLESYVDDNGVGKDDIALIVADLFSRDLVRDPAHTITRVASAIDELCHAGLVWRYETDGSRLLYVAFWEDVQRVDKPQAGRHRRPDGTMNYKDSRILASPREPSRGVPKSTEAISGTPEGSPDTLAAPISTGDTVSVQNSAELTITAGHGVVRDILASPREASRSLAPGTGEQGNRGTVLSRAADADAAPSDDKLPTPPKTPRRKPEIPIPEDWRPAEDHKTYADEHRLDLGQEAFRFRNHAISNDRRCRDWNAAFRNWLSKATPAAVPAQRRAERAAAFPEAWL